MEHKKWEPGSLYAQAMRDITNEHNATVDALKEAQTRYMDVIAENNRLDRELDGARQALKQPLRVPFSGEQIEKMAKAMHNAGMEYMRNLNPCGPTYRSWDEESEVAKDGRKLMVRAAVAAGGLEPCPVPEYRPEEVALTPSADEVEKLARVLDNAETEYLQHNQSREVCFNVMACAAIAHLRPTQGNVLRDRLVEARLKVENQRVELARLNKQREGDSRLIAKLHAQLDALHPGETIEGVVMERDHYRIQLEREQEWTKQYKADRDDAMAELAALRERAEQAEAERDDLQCESSIIGELRAVLGLGWGESITERCKELAALAPFLREPVGWELDAPEGGWLSEGFCIHNPSTGETHSLDSFVSHVCSRIRPVYECKECAAWKTKYNESNQEINKALEAFGIAMPALSAARAALEGE